jgi:hypothetical protein
MRETPAHLDDHGPLMLGRNFDLLAGWRYHGIPHTLAVPAGARRWRAGPAALC